MNIKHVHFVAWYFKVIYSVHSAICIYLFILLFICFLVFCQQWWTKMFILQLYRSTSRSNYTGIVSTAKIRRLPVFVAVSTERVRQTACH